jgi:hypothetical protein
MLAHNFDAELLFNDSVDRGIEKIDGCVAPSASVRG